MQGVKLSLHPRRRVRGSRGVQVCASPVPPFAATVKRVTTSRGRGTGDKVIQFGAFAVQLVNARSQTAQIGDKIRVVLQDVTDGIERMPRRCVELGGFDQVGGNFEGNGPSHNRPYVTRRPEPLALSGRRST